MNRCATHFVFVLSCLLLLSACGQTAPARNARLELAAEHSQSGQRAFDRGDYQAALRQYEMALQADMAIENISGIAVDTLNLARVNQMLGKLVEANTLLDALLQDSALDYEPSYLAAAALQKSLLSLRQGDVKAAHAWVEKSVSYCADKCGISNVIDNARAAIALREKDHDQALHWAERAASASRNASPVEYANALRHMGEARLLRGEFVAALRTADEALTIDKSLGLPEKIRLDLLLAADASEGQGNAEQARRYRERASRIRGR